MAIKTFADQITADLFAGVSTKQSRRLPQRLLPAARKMFAAVDGATRLADLQRVGWELHELKYDKPGFHSVKVNDQYRLVFRFADGDAYDVQLVDYHD